MLTTNRRATTEERHPTRTPRTEHTADSCPSEQDAEAIATLAERQVSAGATALALGQTLAEDVVGHTQADCSAHCTANHKLPIGVRSLHSAPLCTTAVKGSLNYASRCAAAL